MKNNMVKKLLTLNQLETALTASNHNDGAGRLNAGEEALIVRAEGAIQNLDDVRNTVVRSEDGRLTRVADLAEGIMHLPVRIGSPRGVKGLVELVKSPAYATAVGLCLFEAGKSGGSSKKPRTSAPAIGGGLWEKIVNWFKEVF